jgi:hypothetical protein
MLLCWSAIGWLAELWRRGLFMLAGSLGCCDGESSLVWWMVPLCRGPKNGHREGQRGRERTAVRIGGWQMWNDRNEKRCVICGCSLRPGPAFAHGTTGAKWTVAPPPPVNKSLPHNWTTMRQQRYEGKAEMWSVRAMHTFSCNEISGAMLQ